MYDQKHTEILLNEVLLNIRDLVSRKVGAGQTHTPPHRSSPFARGRIGGGHFQRREFTEAGEAIGLAYCVVPEHVSLSMRRNQTYTYQDLYSQCRWGYRGYASWILGAEDR